MHRDGLTGRVGRGLYALLTRVSRHREERVGQALWGTLPTGAPSCQTSAPTTDECRRGSAGGRLADDRVVRAERSAGRPRSPARPVGGVAEAARELGYHPHARRASWPAAGADPRLRPAPVGRAGRRRRRCWPRPSAAWPPPPGRAGTGSSSSRSAPATGTYADLLRSQRADGLIVSGPRIDDDELAELVRDGFPVVLQGVVPGLRRAERRRRQRRRGAAAPSSTSSRLGHRRIACITNAPLAYTAAPERLAGYRGGARGGRASPPDPELVAEGAFDAASGHAAMAELLAQHVRPTPSSWPATSWPSAPSRALREAGLRVPDDISVVGFDDIPLAAYFDPPLTTVRLPAYALGAAAGRALDGRVAGRPVEHRTLLPTRAHRPRLDGRRGLNPDRRRQPADMTGGDRSYRHGRTSRGEGLVQNRTFQGAPTRGDVRRRRRVARRRVRWRRDPRPVDGRRRVTERGGHGCGAVGRGHGRRRTDRRFRQHRRRVERRHRPQVGGVRLPLRPQAVHRRHRRLDQLHEHPRHQRRPDDGRRRRATCRTSPACPARARSSSSPARAPQAARGRARRPGLQSPTPRGGRLRCRSTASSTASFIKAPSRA